MNERQVRSLRAFTNAVAFLEEQATPNVPELAHLRASLRATVEELRNATGEQQATGGRLVASARRQLDHVREKHMLPLARLTRRLFVGETAIQAALRVPHKRAPAGEILAASAVMTKALRPHRRFLTASRVDTRRIERLREETRQAKKLLDAAAARTPTRTLATRRLPRLFVSARADLAAIDALMAASCSAHQLYMWRNVSRVGKRLGRPRTRRRLPPSA